MVGKGGMGLGGGPGSWADARAHVEMWEGGVAVGVFGESGLGR